MGNVASRLDDAGILFFKDQNRCTSRPGSQSENSPSELMASSAPVSIASVTISNSRRRLLTLSPNAFPAARYTAKRDAGDETPIEYIQVPLAWKQRRGTNQLICVINNTGSRRPLIYISPDVLAPSIER